MIMKMGEEMVKEASVGSLLGPAAAAGAGYWRASELSEPDKKTLREEYGLPENANLEARNAGRGVLGGFGGALLGTIGGYALATPLALRGNILTAASLPIIGSWGGSALGAWKATDKYSSERAAKLRNRKKWYS